MIDLSLALLITIGCGVVTIAGLFFGINKITVDDQKAQKIANAISTGAMTFLKEEYTVIMAVVLIVSTLIAYFVSSTAAFIFGCGALLSMTTGFIGMKAATSANVRTTMAAKNQGEHVAFLVSFFGGGVMGFAVATFGLLGLTGIFYFLGSSENLILYLTCFSLGASLVAFFARIGGGIFTKSADVGADLVGKIEAGIPEDDPRNPAVIADNVGDCVGDTAGMGADIYESYVGAMVSTVILGLTIFKNNPAYAVLPIIFAALGLISSIIGLFSNLVLKSAPAAMLRNATYVAIAVFLGLTYWFITATELPFELFYVTVIGCLSGIIIGRITEYYTGSTPVERLAESCQTGAATNVIYGLALGMESVVIPVILLGGAILAAYMLGGNSLYAVSLAAVAMLATVGITMTVDAYGPIADNAGGIAEMSGFGKEVRTITDKLDTLGNTTAAIGKGFAIGSALLTALAMFAAYAESAGLTELNVLDPIIMVGIFVGGTIPFLISAFTMRSVGKTAWSMVQEVRRQFKSIPGLMEGKAEPDYARCVAISTRAALHEMILPGIITILTPIIIFFAFGTKALGGLLVGSTVTGVMLALFMANVGGAWDNAKKYIEAGNLGGKGSDAHKAAVVGDTIGDPCKDTSGPALNILIKLMSVVALLLVSL